MDTYQHVTAELRREAAERIAEYLASGGTPSGTQTGL